MFSGKKTRLNEKPQLITKKYFYDQIDDCTKGIALEFLPNCIVFSNLISHEMLFHPLTNLLSYEKSLT